LLELAPVDFIRREAYAVGGHLGLEALSLLSWAECGEASFNTCATATSRTWCRTGAAAAAC